MNKHLNKREFCDGKGSLWNPEILFANCRGDGVKNLSSLALSGNYDERFQRDFSFRVVRSSQKIFAALRSTHQENH
jgi:hypothetical protein